MIFLTENHVLLKCPSMPVRLSLEVDAFWPFNFGHFGQNRYIPRGYISCSRGFDEKVSKSVFFSVFSCFRQFGQVDRRLWRVFDRFYWFWLRQNHENGSHGPFKTVGSSAYPEKSVFRVFYPKSITFLHPRP